MSDVSRLRMPEHEEPELEGFLPVMCRGGREPGYAMKMEGEHFGHLHCNRCGWVTPEKVTLVYSPDTDNHYLTWEDYVKEEANGWVVVGTVDRSGTAPIVIGPYDTKEHANRARARLSRKWTKEERREHGPDARVHTSVRVLWKD